MITRRVKDLPVGYGIPNDCEQCWKFIGYESPSRLVWVTDGTPRGTHGFCSMKCAKLYNKQKKEEDK